MNPYENLANAIVSQAAKDYKAEFKKFDRLMEREPPPDKKKKKKNAQKQPHENWEDRVTLTAAELDSIERFFRSQWFGALSDADGPTIFKAIKKEAERL